VANSKQWKAVKFPTGLVVWLDADGRVTGKPETTAKKLGRRDPGQENEPNAFEVFLKTLMANGGVA
jgi:hypothetical protein